MEVVIEYRTALGVLIETEEWVEEMVPSVGDHVTPSDISGRKIFQVISRTFTFPNKIKLVAEQTDTPRGE